MPGVRHADRVILMAITLSIPSIRETFDSAMTPAALLLRFVAALMICWAGGAIVERVFDTYSRQARQTEIARQIARMAALRAGQSAEQAANASPATGSASD
jgi:uncharacterized membrane protein YraQ (UPF0718 family)